MKNGTLPMPESRNGKLHYRIEIGVCSVEELGKLNYMKRELELYKEFASSYASLVERAILEEDIAQLLG